MAERTDGSVAALRCRLLAEELAPDAHGRTERLHAVAADADQLGLDGVARSARAAAPG